VTELLAWVDGELVPITQATVSVLDRGFRSGEAVFETLRAYGDHPFRLDAHVQRARSGAEVLGFSLDGEVLRAAVTATATANAERLGGEDSALRLTASAGSLDPASPFPGAPYGDPTVVVTSHRLAIDPRVYADGVTAITVALTRELPQVKGVSYAAALAARRRARAAGADEALLISPDDRILEGASSNVFAVVDGRLVTPPLKEGLLEGVTRGVVLQLAASQGIDVELRTLHRDELLGATEAFLTASVRQLMPLVAVDGSPLTDGRPGTVTRAMQAAYRAEVEREISG
jgi:branched-subunit amino acid aminotransferase/4-amino-4-deoxychorismate lyase